MSIEVTLDALLRERGMTVAQLADAVGITPANIFVLKNGRAKAIRFSTLNALCAVLECTPAQLLAYVPDLGNTPTPGS